MSYCTLYSTKSKARPENNAGNSAGKSIARQKLGLPGGVYWG